MTRPIVLTACILLLAIAGPAAAADPLASRSDVELITEVETILQGGAVDRPIRCLFPHVAELAARGLDVAAFSTARTDSLYAYDTPEGNFRVEYRLTGAAAVDPTDDDASGVPDYVEWVGEAMEQSHQREVVELGFTFPEGGRYLVRLAALGPGTYGLTQPDDAAFGRSTISMNADFAGFFAAPAYRDLTNDDPDGVIRGAIRVTAAHEFKHALQLYTRWQLETASIGWFEVDAVWMEDVVYDGVNDYYNYLWDPTSPFRAPHVSLIGNATYDDGTWQIFLEQRHGIDFLKRLHDRRSDFNREIFHLSYKAVADELQIDWLELWREYALANYLTGDRAAQGKGFEEAPRYPTSTADTLETLESPAVIEGSVNQWANRFYEYDNADRQTAGQLEVTVTTEQVGGWAMTVVLQNVDRTITVPLRQQEPTETFVIGGYDVANYDRIALVVGNSTTTSTALLESFDVQFALDPEVDVVARSFGSIKARY